MYRRCGPIGHIPRYIGSLLHHRPGICSGWFSVPDVRLMDSEARDEKQLKIVRRRAIIACFAGNLFELYDFVVFGFFAIQIGKAVFPSHDPITSLLASFATYGTGFLTRPIGALVLGSYGDRRGRKIALSLTIT